AFDAKGSVLALAGGVDAKVRRYAIPSGKELPVLEPPAPDALAPTPGAPPPTLGMKRPPTALAFSRDGKTLAVGSADGNVHLYETATGALSRTLSPHPKTQTAGL